tara:strand:- start:2977 stop:3177 length:201 start_codon:yes stop_codon:yes gene_type:complete
VKVKVRNNNIETALRAFKKKASETVFEYRERQYYDSPSAKRHRAKKAAQTREKRRQAQDKTPTRKY